MNKDDYCNSCSDGYSKRKYFIRILSDNKGLAAILAGKEESIAVNHILLGSETSKKQDFNYAQLYDPLTTSWKTSLT